MRLCRDNLNKVDEIKSLNIETLILIVMKFICNFLLVLNYIVYIIADVCAWADNIKYGLLFLLPLFVFPIVVKLANKVAVSQADKFFKSEWDVFLKKLKWGNSVVFAIVALGYWLFFSQSN